MKKYKYTKNIFYEGVRYRVYADTKEELYQKKADKLTELKNNQTIVDPTMKVRDWSKTVLETYKSDTSSKTRYGLEGYLKNHILNQIGDMPIKNVKPIHCQKILNNMRGYSKDMIARIYQLMQLIFKTAQDNHLILSNPMNGTIKPEGHVNHRRTITEEERIHLIKVCKENTRFVPFMFMLYCGCRPEEARNIKKSDIQQIKGVPVLHIRGTKTVNANRYVPLKPEIRNYIEPLNESESEFYALSEKGTPHNESSYAALVKALKRAMNLSMGAKTYRNKLVEPLPLAKDFTPYCIRHTYCTDLKKAGVPLSIAKDYMGHANISITADIYSHADDDTLIAGAKILGIEADE